ncbi:thioredoxin [Tenacibaculum holothuriorum]|uniref:Thioredoxin n=1 Tax=Tenacibaculum holothuriorum TaxID=1635173 RepID=A0A1Y2PE22_9FLAO|nr:thioredoxin fold domain-containing protein [Tenacibaculum holothuriorum]OSY88723.1 thioredoxin [Tenacibaculum holothuriorum]
MKPFKANILFLFFFGNFAFTTIAQQKQKVNWISFEQLDDSLAVKPKKVFISFYADWCVYCKKMDKVTFKNPDVISVLNSEYYAVKMDSETQKTIAFEGRTYTNKQIGKSRNPTHQIPLLLASRKNRTFSLPATVILDKTFKVTQRHFEYLSSKKMLKILKK